MTLRGLVDSGADSTVLPWGYPQMLGFTVADLREDRGQQVLGEMHTYRSVWPVRAVLPGLEKMPFDLEPVFVPGARTVLWGRLDFMRHWDVLFRGPEKQLILTPRQSKGSGIDG